MTTTNAEITALISLLDDDDDLVFLSVREKITSIGSEVLPLLEDALLKSDNRSHISNLEKIIDQLKKELLLEKFQLWLRSENRNLLDGWLLVSSIHHPNLSKDKIEHQIHKIYLDAWLEISESMTSLEKVAVINHILFRVYNFEIADLDTPSVDQISLDKLLFSRSGNVYSLTTLYLILARSLRLELTPIMLANKLLLVYEDSIAAALAFGPTADKYLFYVNVAHRGSVISPKEVQFLYNKSQKQGKLITRVETDSSMIRKLLGQMYIIYSGEGDYDKTNLIEDLLNLFDPI